MFPLDSKYRHAYILNHQGGGRADAHDPLENEMKNVSEITKALATARLHVKAAKSVAEYLTGLLEILDVSASVDTPEPYSFIFWIGDEYDEGIEGLHVSISEKGLGEGVEVGRVDFQCYPIGESEYLTLEECQYGELIERVQDYQDEKAPIG